MLRQLNDVGRSTNLNQENLEENKQTDTGWPFVALRLEFHHYSTLLYLRYLETKDLSTLTLKTFKERCQRYARLIVRCSNFLANQKRVQNSLSNGWTYVHRLTFSLASYAVIR
jgi:ribosomal protein S18 acetylase RimI-like enzyme